MSRVRSIFFSVPAEVLLSEEALDEAFTLAQRAEQYAKEPGEKAYALYNQAKALERLEEFDRARELALQSRSLNPGNSWVHSLLADIAIETRNFDDVEAHLVECKRYATVDFPCYELERRISVAWTTGDVHLAHELLDEYVALTPDRDYALKMQAWYQARTPGMVLSKDEYEAKQAAYAQDCPGVQSAEYCYREAIELLWANSNYDGAQQWFDWWYGGGYMGRESTGSSSGLDQLYSDFLADRERYEEAVQSTDVIPLRYEPVPLR